MAGFLVPFAAGGIAKALEIRNEYDENAGNLVDAASEKYNAQFDKNQKAIELQNANFAAVEKTFGTAVAEVAAKQGLLTDVDTGLVIDNVKKVLGDKYIKHIERVTKGKDIKTELGYQSLFTDDYKAATASLEENRKWAANHLNKGAVKNISDLYLAGGKELPEPTGFLFGDRVTEGTGVAYEQAVAKEIGKEIPVQPTKVSSSMSLEERLGYADTAFIGTIREQDTALANILTMEGATITNEGIAFPAANKNHANAIKFLAASLIDQDTKEPLWEKHTNEQGKVDTSNLFIEANNYILKEIITPMGGMFIDYGVPKGMTVTKMTERVMHTGGGFNEKWLEANGLSTSDIKPYVASGAGTSKVRSLNKFIVSDKVYKVISELVETFPPEVQKVYIDYLPNNLLYKDSNKTIKERLRAEFGLKQYI